MQLDISKGLLTAVIIANMVFAFTVVFIERRRPVAAVAWLLVFASLPVLGFVLYMIFGQRLLKQKKFRLKKEDDRELMATIENQHRHLQQLQAQPIDAEVADYIGIIHMNLTQALAPLTFDNKVTIFQHGIGKFTQLLADIRQAKKFIHMEYFIFRPDRLGKQLLAALTEKAAEGVEVRLIIDDWGCRCTPMQVFEPLQKAGGQVYRFLPVRLTFAINANYRNHRKIVIIDGNIGYTGGMNVGEEYLGLHPQRRPWRDAHLRVVGSAVFYLEARFLMDWIYVSGEEIELGERYLPQRVFESGQVPMQIVSSGPDSEEQHVKQGYLKIINSATETLYIQTPYLVPDESILEAIKIASFSGVDVKIMIPNIPDYAFVYRVTLAYAGELLQAGVQIYKYPGFIHSKTVVADGKVLSVGTANMDRRSFSLNFEVNAFIYDTVLAQEQTSAFLQDMAISQELTLEEYEQRGLWHRFSEGICRLFAPIM